MPERNGAPATSFSAKAMPAPASIIGPAYLPDARASTCPMPARLLGDRLAVADTANSRLIGYSATDLAMGAAAALLTGQPDFQSKGDNRWKLPVRDSLCWPYGLSACGDMMVVSDSGNNRVLLWRAAS